MLTVALLVALAYAIGSLLGSQVLTAALGGPDIREMGSGNAGATNALRQRGIKFGLGVLAFDMFKGVFAVAGVPWLAAQLSTLPLPTPQVGMLCGVAVTAGHIWPVFYRFAGGKGIATLLGVYACMTPAALLIALPGFVLVLVLTGFVSLSALMAAVLIVFHVACIGPHGAWSPLGLFSLVMLALVVWTHRQNIRRLRYGIEPRFDRVRLLHRARQ